MIKTLRNYAMYGVIGTALGLFNAHLIGKSLGQKTVLESIGEQATEMYDRIETERAIRAEGIQAKSYAEAKAKLDSIRFDRVCKEVGVPVPQKPASNATMLEELDYQSKVFDIYGKANTKHLNEIIETLKTIKE